ncbi:MAG: hypothetical protein ABI981_11345 [Betaproteobacteria bacterium]
MDSIWWALAIFLAGGSLGILVMALMSMSGGLPEQVVRVDDGGVHPDMIGQATEF